MKTIVLDTDFILNSLEWKIDIKEELKRVCDFNFEICVLDRTFDELKGKKLERLAVRFIEQFKVIETSRDRTVDELLLEMKDIMVATQDRELKEKLKKGGFAIITIRQKKYLIIDNVL